MVIMHICTLFVSVYMNALQLNSNHLQGNKEIEQQEEKVGQQKRRLRKKLKQRQGILIFTSRERKVES